MRYEVDDSSSTEWNGISRIRSRVDDVFGIDVRDIKGSDTVRVGGARNDTYRGASITCAQ